MCSDMGRRSLRQRHRGGHVHEGSGLVSSAHRVQPELAFRCVNKNSFGYVASLHATSKIKIDGIDDVCA